MDIQSKAKKLIEMIQTAPVEWKPLGEVAEYSKNRICSDKLNEHNYVGVDNLLQNREGKKLSGYVPSEGKMTEYIVNDILIGNIRPYLKKIWQADCTGGTNGDVLVIRVTDEKVNPKYLYQVLADDKFFAFNMKHAKGAKMPRGSKTAIMQYKIPIPPLETQQKIVKILDKFTELEAMLETALEAELALRKRQYQYYRDFILDFDNQIWGRIADGYKGRLKDVVWKTLGEVGTLIRGNGLQKKDFTEDGIPAIHYGQIYTHYGTFASKTKSFVSARLAEKLKKAQYGDVLIAGTSENIQDVMTPVGWLGGEIVFSGDMFAFRPNTEINTKYLTYMLQTTMFQKYKEKYAQGTKVIRVKGENFLKFEIPIPPLPEQEKIVAILDKFDTLTNSISEGLPHEIALRRKQYEYYREQLLAFPKAA